MSHLLSPFIALLVNSDPSDLKNYRPVSNLPLLSKLLERVVQARLLAHLDGNSLLPGWQSAYRRFHSTETAVTKVFNDLLMAVDRGQMSVLCLLDLSAAFDTVDHDLLLQRLERQFGLRGTALQWVCSYLSGRTFRVLYGDVMSFIVYVMYIHLYSPHNVVAEHKQTKKQQAKRNDK